MKKTIVVEILLLFALAILIMHTYIQFSNVHFYLRLIKNSDGQYNDLYDVVRQCSIYGTLDLLAALCTIAAGVIVAIINFPAFKPLTDKLSAKWTARKERIAAEKEAQAEVAKQARIEQLQAELDELKKDE